MLHHVCYYQLKDDVSPFVLEEMLRASRSWLLKMPEVLSVKSGRNLDPKSQWQFFYAIEVESRDKLEVVKDDAYYLKFMQQFVKPHTCNEFGMDFELDPSRELKYS